MRRLIHAQLLPVVEVEPRGGSRRVPSGTLAEKPPEWDTYWRDSLAARGFPEVEPIRQGSWLVDIDHFSDAALSALLSDHVERMGDGDFALGEPLALDGGFVLVDQGIQLLDPTCCGDLGNLQAWDAAADWRSPDWDTLWIGHPWIAVRFDGESLMLSDYCEQEPPHDKFQVEPGTLKRAVEAAGRRLEAFSRRLESLMKERSKREARLVARRLVGLEGR